MKTRVDLNLVQVIFMAEQNEQPYRLLCMDGGGIYGYFTVLMLKRFAEKYKNFLRSEDSFRQVSAFAGTSAGALISMLLAKEENPREYLLSGALDEFFASDLLHGNQLDPYDAVTSLFGLTTWCGGKDMQALLKKEFGDRRLGDLPHKVLIMTFDMSGETSKRQDQRSWKTKVYHNFNCRGNDMDVPAWFVAYGAACPATVRPVIDGISDGGIYAMSPTLSAVSQLISIAKLKTERVDQYLKTANSHYAMGAHVPRNQGVPIVLKDGSRVVLPPRNPMTRLIAQGSRDPNDVQDYEQHLLMLRGLLEEVRRSHNLITEAEYQRAYDAVKHEHLAVDDEETLLTQIRDAQIAELAIVGCLRKVLNDPLRHDLPVVDERAASYDQSDPYFQLRSQAWMAHAELYQELQDIANDPHPLLRVLNGIQVLSLGVGAEIPSFFTSNFNLGFLNFNMFPTNPYQKVWTPPALHLLYSPSTDHTDYESRQLLGDNYYRCSPPVIGWPTPPVVLSLYLARFKPLRTFILNGITEAMSRADVDLASCEAWLTKKGWSE